MTRLDLRPAGTPATPLRLELDRGRSVQARTIVVASGARYRRPDISNLSDFEGAGVSYWASPIEAKLCEGEEVALVGGGNSAGQAVVFLAPKVKRLHLDRARPLGSDDVALSDRPHRGAAERRAAHRRRSDRPSRAIETGGLTAATFRERCDREDRSLSDAAPVPVHRRRSQRRPGSTSCVAVDGKGFVITGSGFADRSRRPRAAAAGDQLPGVFAIGDVRAGIDQARRRGGRRGRRGRRADSPGVGRPLA